MKRIDRYIRCFQGVIDQDTLFIVPEDYNALCKVNLLQKRKTEIEIWMDDNNMLSGREFYSVILSDGWLILAPGKSDYVIIYHLDTETLKRIDICEPRISTNEIYNKEVKFFCGFFYNNNVYLIAATYPAILKINIETEETTYIDDWIEEIRDRIPEGDRNWYFSPGFVRDGNYAYISSSTSGSIVRLDCNTDKTCVFKSYRTIKILHGMIKYKEDMWVLAATDCNTGLIRWDPEMGFLEEILVEPIREKAVWWCSPLEIDGIIYLFQSNGKNVYKVDMQEKKAALCEEVADTIGKIPQKINDRYLGVRLICEYKKKIIFMIQDTRIWFEFDTVKQKIDSFVLEIIDDEYEKRYLNAPYMKELDVTLVEFLKAIKDTGDGGMQEDNKQKGIIAEQIYAECKVTG